MPSRDGVGELRLDGELVGYVATSLSDFWSHSRPRHRQWWVWLIVVWADGTREYPCEDYPPWTYVTEMTAGYFIWESNGARDGRYEFAWLSATDAHVQRMRLGIRPEDF